MARIAGLIPFVPTSAHSNVHGAMPWFWFGTRDRDGDAAPWIKAPIGSLYIYYSGSAIKIYFKDANAGADADWGTVDLTT